MTDLEARLRRLEDRIEIEELLARYSLACDDRDMESLAACFAVDYEFDSVAGRSVGRAAAMEYYQERLGMYGVTFHVPHTLVLEHLGDTSARGIVTSHAEMEIGRDMFVTGFRYHDEYVREENRWCFRAREVRALYAMPLHELAGSLDRLRVRWPNTPASAAPIPELLPTWRDFQRLRQS